MLISHVNATEGHIICDEKTEVDGNKGDVFRKLRKKYGKCTGKVYIDKKDGRTLHTGWVFVKNEKYEDTKEKYLHEVWASRLQPEKLIALDE